jgi:hypothetical protein
VTRRRYQNATEGTKGPACGVQVSERLYVLFCVFPHALLHPSKKEKDERCREVTALIDETQMREDADVRISVFDTTEWESGQGIRTK